ncbi:hypothetical protein I3215_17170 [Streptomyces sp. RB110-1]|uniref:hypothetical protein n=1 Tax=unclassified Streptomyces TaxID=2593676 RepID=UPI0018FFAA1D|nr:MULTISPECIES: hypothetical protein [unclassified Streptomyces]MBK0374615.1 hypothetical protein [Streptomyces sp. RB110-1]MBK0389015.1 hypothetical protein [Streptomyces sp. RB110-2]
MTESWKIEAADALLSPDAVVEAVRARTADGLLETWLTSSSGRSLALVSNTVRAMVVLLERDGDPGEHAVDPQAEEGVWSDGFVLSNGQDDAYPDRDTVPVEEAYRLVTHLVDTGHWPPDAHWVAER